MPANLTDVTVDEEAKFVSRAALWMVVLAVTPLILFYIVHFFQPELFLIPITPNQAEVIP